MDDLQLFTTVRYDPKLRDVHDNNVGWHQQASPFYMLDLHRDRMLKAAEHFGWEFAILLLRGNEGLRTLDTFLDDQVARVVSEPHRVKILISRRNIVSVVKAAVEDAHVENLFPSYLPSPFTETEDPASKKNVPVRDSEFEVLLDTASTTRSSYTHFKTTYRPMYDEARRRMSIGLTDKKEVLLINSQDGSVMEGSITTPYFWRNGRWVTPPIPADFDPTSGSGGNYGTTRRWALERNLAVEEVVPADSLVNGEECWLSNGVKGFAIYAAQNKLKEQLNLCKVEVVRNQDYERNGLKSYVHLLHKYNIEPTLDGPYVRIDRPHSGIVEEVKHLLGRHNTILVKKSSPDPNAKHGEVTAKDIQGDSEYLCKVTAGTPAQPFFLDFDTGSADLWVFAPAVAGSGKNKHNSFDSAKSSTFKNLPGKTWQIQYGDGSSASGTCGTDTITIGGLHIKNQTIEIATKAASQFLQGASDGLLGLAFSKINTVHEGLKPDPQHTPVENMISQDDIPKTSELFTSAFYGSRDKEATGSFYSFGFIDEKLVKSSGHDISWVNIDNSQGFWSFPSTSISINGKSHPISGGTAIADTGTTLVLLPDAVVKAIYAAIPGSKYDWINQGYIFPTDVKASQIPVIDVAVGNKMFTIQKEDIAFSVAKEGYWYGGIQSRGTLPFNIMGDTFLKSIYAIWDVGNKRFGAVPKLEQTQDLTPPQTGAGQDEI
ncbi:aspartic peptidase domain-containing protein [Xylariaceae sp. FL0255]|nr:aspartic peptidase domain-containing protein [Xylariaceae sp. FL0255]